MSDFGKTIKVMRGTAALCAATTPAQGELMLDTENNLLYVGDGSTAGGILVGRTTESLQDLVGAMLTGNTETFITVTYEDGDGTIDFVVPVKDEDNMVSDSNVHLATQQSIKFYVDYFWGDALTYTDTVMGFHQDETTGVHGAGVNTLLHSGNIGSSIQAYDAGLTNLAAVAMAADKMYYTSADNVHVAADLTAFARTILDDANAGAVLATLGAVIGTNVQAWDADLDTYAGITPSANIQTFLASATFAAMLTNLSGQAAAAFDWNSQNLTSVGTLNTHTIPGGTDTFALIAAAQELTKKTLNAAVGKGTWTASGTWTIPAITLGGTVTFNGQNIDVGSGYFSITGSAAQAMGLQSTLATQWGPAFDFWHNSASPANYDYIGQYYYKANNDNTPPDIVTYGYVIGVQQSIAHGSEIGQYRYFLIDSGAINEVFRILATGEAQLDYSLKVPRIYGIAAVQGAARPLHIGDAGGTSHGLTSEDDLVATGKAEFNGNVFLDSVKSGANQGAAGAAAGEVWKNSSTNALYLGV